jgi:hypothetical protein
LGLRPAGQAFILLNAAVVQPEQSLSEASLASTWRLGPSSLDIGHSSYVQFEFTSQLKALRPLPPVRLKSISDASGVALSWIRQTRTNGDSWDLIEVPLGEDTELYKLDILNGATLVRSISLPASNYFYSTANLIADFGSVPPSFTARVSQLSAATGPGAVLERIINV